MGLVDDVRAATRRPGGKCGIPGILLAHPEIADELRELLAQPVYVAGHRAIATALREKHDVMTSGDAIGRHRNGECRCPR